jgi:predicted nuclease with TOPRIM domain
MEDERSITLQKLTETRDLIRKMNGRPDSEILGECEELQSNIMLILRDMYEIREKFNKLKQEKDLLKHKLEHLQNWFYNKYRSGEV